MKVVLFVAFCLASQLVGATKFIIKNNLGYNVNVGGHGDFTLGAGKSKTISVANGWHGRIYGHHGDSKKPTLAEFSINSWDGNDFYDLSIIDGYNLPMSIIPHRAGCPAVHCKQNGCPDAYHFPTDDTKTHGCKNTDYDIVFG